MNFYLNLLVGDNPDASGALARLIAERLGAGKHFRNAKDGDVADLSVAVVRPFGSRWIVVSSDDSDSFGAALSEVDKIVHHTSRWPSVLVMCDDETLPQSLEIARASPSAMPVHLINGTDSANADNPVCRVAQMLVEDASTKARLRSACLAGDVALVADVLGLPQEDWHDVESASEKGAITLRFKSASRPAQPPPESVLRSTRLIPKFVLGGRADARRQWKRVCRKAVAAGSWESHLDNLDYVDLDVTPGSLILSRDYFDPRENDIRFDFIHEGLMDACGIGLSDLTGVANRNIWYQRIRDLTLTGMDHFWFCMGVMAETSGLLFPASEIQRREAADVALKMLVKILHWWPDLCQLDSRIRRPADDKCICWGINALRLCGAIGVSRSELTRIGALDAISAGTEIGILVEKGIS